MREISEDLIERYVAFPETLDDRLRASIEAHLASDPAARQVAEFYRDYYERFRAEDDLEPDAGGEPNGEPQP